MVDKKNCIRTGMFALCYLAWVSVHCQREFWALSKKTIAMQNPNLSKTFFGAADTSLFLSYSIAQFGTGAIGDTYAKRKVLSISFTIQAILFGLLGLTYLNIGEGEMEGKGWQFCLFFVGIGLIQSVDFPCFISTVAAWTERKTRGIVTGIWATCSNSGNVVGIQLATLILGLQDDHWQNLMFYIMAVYFTFAVLIFFFFVSTPQEVGIHVKDQEEDDDFEGAVQEGRIGFCEALAAPSVLLYGFCFFTVKFAVYSLMLWLPIFLAEEFHLDNKQISGIVTIYEIGTLFGAVILGLISDFFYAKRSPIIAIAVLISAIVSFVITGIYTDLSPVLLRVLFFILGFSIGTTHHLICITCTADLGREQKNKRATSTITGIVDGIGTGGAALGQLFISIMVDKVGWKKGFMLPISIGIVLTFLPLSKILYKEIEEIRLIRRQQNE